MSDVPAIYFCLPTKENLRRIAKDIENGLYGSYHFISPILRERLRNLAMSIIRAVQQVQKLFDQCVNFICLENEMFVLRHQESSCISYHTLNMP